MRGEYPQNQSHIHYTCIFCTNFLNISKAKKSSEWKGKSIQKFNPKIFTVLGKSLIQLVSMNYDNLARQVLDITQ